MVLSLLDLVCELTSWMCMVCACVWKPEIGLGCHFSNVVHFVLGDRVSRCPGAHQLNWAAWLASPVVLHGSAPPHTHTFYERVGHHDELNTLTEPLPVLWPLSGP